MCISQSSIVRKEACYNADSRDDGRSAKGVLDAIVVHQPSFHLDIWRKSSERGHRMSYIIDDLFHINMWLQRSTEDETVPVLCWVFQLRRVEASN